MGDDRQFFIFYLLLPLEIILFILFFIFYLCFIHFIYYFILFYFIFIFSLLFFCLHEQMQAPFFSELRELVGTRLARVRPSCCGRFMRIMRFPLTILVFFGGWARPLLRRMLRTKMHQEQ